MASLPHTNRGSVHTLATSLTASVTGLIAGMGIMALITAGLLDHQADEASQTAPSPIATRAEVSALTEELAVLEALNSQHAAMIARLTAAAPANVLPPTNLDRLLDRVITRSAAPALTLDEINAMLDAGF